MLITFLNQFCRFIYQELLTTSTPQNFWDTKKHSSDAHNDVSIFQLLIIVFLIRVDYLNICNLQQGFHRYVFINIYFCKVCH